MASKIIYVEPDSLAEEAGIEAGDVLLKLSGHEIHDILEYRYLMSEYEVTVTVEKKNGDIEEIIIENDYDFFADIHSNKGLKGPGTYKKTNFVFNLAGVNRPKDQSEFMSVISVLHRNCLKH